jgi:hypothetical protein
MATAVPTLTSSRPPSRCCYRGPAAPSIGADVPERSMRHTGIQPRRCTQPPRGRTPGQIGPHKRWIEPGSASPMAVAECGWELPRKQEDKKRRQEKGESEYFSLRRKVSVQLGGRPNLFFSFLANQNLVSS